MTKIISTHSYRGGTGKSNITANLACQLARPGRRVGIVDTDILSPGIHVLFQVDPKAIRFTLNDYLWGRCAIEEAALEVTSAVCDLQGRPALHGDAGIFLVPSSIKAGEIARIIKESYDVSLLSDGLRDLCERLKLDYLLLDTHPGLNEETLLSIALSDVLLLILRPDRQDYQGTAVTIEVARRLEVPEMLLVINKALTSFDFRELQSRVEQTYRAPVAGILPLSEDMARLASGGIFSIIFPDSPISRVIADIAARVAG
ncbi:MAG TPA: MinD/ParA family protein [Stellaceae bacterium]|nr:MinD/ParA family protein [Stellaceae bacterium]